MFIHVSLGQVRHSVKTAFNFNILHATEMITAAINWFEELVSVQCSLFLESEPRPNWSL